MSPHDAEFSSVMEAVRAIVPRLRENGLEAEDRRWIPDENIELLEKAGVFRIAVPREFGGLDFSLAQQYAVLTEISRGCASTGWVAVAWVSTAWLATLYPDEAQKDVFASGSVRVSGAFTSSGTLVPTEGGYVLNGTWRFNTGCRGADWDLVAATVQLPDGSTDEAFALVPMAELSIADDWHVSAAAGTGSSTTSARDVFVPAHRLATMGEAMTGTVAGRSNAGATGRNYGLLSMVVAESVAIYLGAAKGAYEEFVAGLPGKPIAYTTWEDQREHPLTQRQVAVAENRIAAAEALFAGQLALLQERADAGVQPSDEEKATVRGRAGAAIQLAREAVEALHSVSSASSLARKGHFQRFHRDIEGLALHGLMNPNMSLEVYGRVLVGLDPATPYL